MDYIDKLAEAGEKAVEKVEPAISGYHALTEGVLGNTASFRFKEDCAFYVLARNVWPELCAVVRASKDLSTVAMMMWLGEATTDQLRNADHKLRDAHDILAKALGEGGG